LYIPIEEKGQPYGVPTLNEYGDVVLNGGVGTVGANSDMAVLAHRTTPDGLARYIAVSKDSDLENAARLTEELEDGSAIAHALLHTGMEDLARTVGAVGLENKSLQFTNYGLVGVNFDEVVNHNYTVGVSEDGYGTRPPESGWVNIINFTSYHFATQIAISCTVGDVEERPIKMWVREKYIGEGSDWSDWDELPTLGKNIVLNVPTNGGYRIKNKNTGAASDFMAGGGYTVMRIMDTYDDVNNYREIMLVGANGSPGITHAVRLLDVVNGVGTSYSLYHEGNSPTAIATAELV